MDVHTENWKIYDLRVKIEFFMETLKKVRWNRKFAGRKWVTFLDTACGRSQGGSGLCGRMWTEGGQKPDFRVDVINGWPLRTNSNDWILFRTKVKIKWKSKNKAKLSRPKACNVKMPFKWRLNSGHLKQRIGLRLPMILGNYVRNLPSGHFDMNRLINCITIINISILHHHYHGY